jgi:sulfur relay (sulfurtransferase) complex TusBCD TusD component (DsrE family)
MNYKHGDKVTIHICNDCARRRGLKPKKPADSGVKSLYCGICEHYNIGSTAECVIGDWLRIIPIKYVNPIS